MLNRRRQFAAIFALSASVWLAFDAWQDIAHVAWTEPEASHIWLAPLVVLWLVSIRRQQWSWAGRGSSWPGVGIFAVGVIAWWLGYQRQIQLFWHLGAVMMSAGSVLAFIGSASIRFLLPAWMGLLFLLPVPMRVRFAIAQPLEVFAAWSTQGICESLGMNVSRWGNQLCVNGLQVCIAEACNGMRLIFTLLLACYVAVYIRPYSTLVRAAVLLLSPVVAVTANIVRLVPTMWLYAHFSLAAADRFHEAAGFVMVVIAFVVLDVMCSLLGWTGMPIYSKPTASKDSRPLGTLASSQVPFVALGVAMLCALVHRTSTPGPESAYAYHQQVRLIAGSIAASNGDWAGTDIPLPQASLDALKTNVAISRRLTNRKTGEAVELLILQSPDIRDLVPHYPPICYPGQGLMLLQTNQINLRWGRTNITASRYWFQRHDFQQGEPVVVDNFLVLPTGETQPDTAGMEGRIGTGNRYFGCAQVQIVSHQLMAPQQRTELTEAVLQPYSGLLNVLEHGVQP